MGLFKKLFGSKETNKSEGQTKKEDIQKPSDQTPMVNDVRLESLSICQSAGFKPSRSLPTELGRQLRPAIEIANRIHAIKALVLWLMVPPENLSNDRILNFIAQNMLMDWMTEDEKAILNAPRDDEQGRNAIGWKFENAWPLAWYFGYTEPEINGQMMSGNQMQEILTKHTCSLDKTINEWIQDN